MAQGLRERFAGGLIVGLMGILLVGIGCGSKGDQGSAKSPAEGRKPGIVEVYPAKPGAPTGSLPAIPLSPEPLGPPGDKATRAEKLTYSLVMQLKGYPQPTGESTGPRTDYTPAEKLTQSLMLQMQGLAESPEGGGAPRTELTEAEKRTLSLMEQMKGKVPPEAKSPASRTNYTRAEKLTQSLMMQLKGQIPPPVDPAPAGAN